MSASQTFPSLCQLLMKLEAAWEPSMASPIQWEQETRTGKVAVIKIVGTLRIVSCSRLMTCDIGMPLVSFKAVKLVKVLLVYS